MTARDLPAIRVVRVDVNGRACELAGEPGPAVLADALRDELGLTGTKIGCHAGDCGACTVLLDGEQVCSCIVGVGQCAGRAVTTVEGLAGADGALSPLQRAFVAHGAAQCGICTPGMLMSAEALLRANPQPTESEVRDALAGVLCRCTGYRKIVEAVLAVAAGAVADAPAARAGQAVGARVARLDAPAKVTGRERFGADALPLSATPVLTMRVVRSPHAHARFEVGDLAALRQRWPGIVDVVSAADVPNNAFAIFPDLRDQPGACRRRGALPRRGGARARRRRGDAGRDRDADMPIRYTLARRTRSERRCARRRRGRHAAARALPRQRPLPRPRRSRRRRGGARRRVASASATFETRHVEHAYIEPEAGYAEIVAGAGGGFERAGVPLRRVRIFACTQTPYMDRDEIASVLKIAPEQVHIVPSAIGGGFGGKLDLSVQPLVAVAAWKLGRAVRLVYERPESMQSSTKRHPATMQASAACDADGRLVAFDFAGDFNTGAYSSWGPTVANRVPIHASGPYRIANVRALTRAVLTHNSVAGAFRGFGVPQSTLLGELLIDELAARAGATRSSSATATRWSPATRRRPGRRWRRASASGLASMRCGQRGRRRRRRRVPATTGASRDGSPRRRGAGIACMWYGIGNTVIANPSTMRGALRWSAERGAHLFLYNGAQEIGQGTATIMPQMFADAVGLEVACVEQVMGDTDLTADAGKSSASRQTFVSGNAAKGAGADLRRQLIERLGFGDRVDADVTLALAGDRLVGRHRGEERALDLRALTASARRGEGAGTVPHSDLFIGTGYFNPPTVPLDADGQGVPYATYAFAAQIAEVEVDVELGTVTAAARPRRARRRARHQPDPGRGQIHGGIAQGIGMALMEEYVNGPHRQPARLPDPDRRRCAADHGPPDRGPGAARAVGRERRRRAGARGDGAGDPQCDPRGDRRSHARGAGDAAPAARGLAGRARR
jgi:CO/xanthine dehydrogenase Mo-binding subunit/aerobic-type carbon monoxide dehydrogenase small subunit (CoxS/CutS family)